MSAAAYERVGLTLTNDAANPGGTSSWIVTGTTDATEATEAVLASAPATATLTVPLGASTVEGTVYRLTADVRELGRGVWEASVVYGLPRSVDLNQTSPPPPPGPPPPPLPSETAADAALGAEYAFDTAGGTRHVVLSHKTRYGRGFGVESTAAGIVGAPNFKQLVGAGKDKVEGADIYVGKIEWSVTAKRVNVTIDYIRTLAELTGCVNAAAFYGRDPEELMLLGASGQFSPGDGWTVTWRFLEGPTRADETIPEGATSGNRIRFPQVKPFDHVWVWYEDQIETVTDPGTGQTVQFTVSRPKYGYVERVQPTGDFSLLGI